MACPSCEPMVYYTTATLQQQVELGQLMHKYIDGIGLVLRVIVGYIDDELVSCIIVDPSMPKSITATFSDVYGNKTGEPIISAYQSVDSLPFKLYRVDEPTC